MAAMTPASWLEVLEPRLDTRWRRWRVLDDYFEGRQRLSFATSKFREAFGSLFYAFADNLCELVVDASAERLIVKGFRFGEPTGADEDAWAIWQDNGLDAASLMAHTEAIKLGEAYAMIEPDGSSSPIITIEHPSQVIVSTVAGRPLERQAALKKWLDEDDGFAYANVYQPGLITKYRSQKKLRAGAAKIDWQPMGRLRTSLPTVPVIPLRNNPSLLAGGRSDLRVVEPLQDVVNKLMCDMVVASEFAAFRQRILTGIEIPDDPVTGQPAQTLSAVSRLMTFADPDVKWGEFGASDLSNYGAAIELVVQHIAAWTRTPPHYLMGKIVNASGDALKAAETGLVVKARKKTLFFGEDWEEIMRVAFLAVGDTKRANLRQAETLWRDPETRTEGELVDALVKMRTLGIPLEMLWERWGLTPQEITRAKTLMQEESLAAGTFLPDLSGSANGVTTNGRVPAGAVNGAGNA